MSENIKELNIVVIGLPGSGKGTQSKKIAEKYNLVHISTGDLLREEAASGSDLGKIIDGYMKGGVLFPDNIVDDILIKNMPKNNYILDGYPRKISQIDTVNNINLVIYLELDEEETIQRILHRHEGRLDDTREAIGTRLTKFRATTTPVIDYYETKGILRKVPAHGTPEEVFERVSKIIDSYP